jgi:large subunit ribosomal protein L21e
VPSLILRVRCRSSIRSAERPKLRRVPALPREARTVSSADNAAETIVPVPYETTI